MGYRGAGKVVPVEQSSLYYAVCNCMCVCVCVCVYVLYLIVSRVHNCGNVASLPRTDIDIYFID